MPAMKEEWEVQRRYSNVARRLMIKEHRTGGNEEENEPPPKFSVFTKGTAAAAAAARQQQQEMKEEKEEDDINSEYRKEVGVKPKPNKHGREKTQQENKHDAGIHQFKTVQGRENQQQQQQQLPQHQQPLAARRGRGESLAATNHIYFHYWHTSIVFEDILNRDVHFPRCLAHANTNSKHVLAPNRSI